MSVTATVAPTLSNVEIATVGFTTGGAFNAGNSSSMTTITVQEATNGVAAAAIVIGILTGTQVIITDSDDVTDSDISTVALDTAASASLTATLRIATASAMTITDAASVTINASATTLTSGVTSLVLDSSDTTSLTVTGATTAFALATGDVTGTNALTSFAVTTTIASGDVTVGSLADADALTSLTITAVNGDVTVGVVGTDSTTNGNAEVLASVVISATGSSTVDIDDVFADDANDEGLAMTISLTAENGSTITTGDLDNADGTLAVTFSGAGSISLGSATATTSERLIAASGTFDLSAATGTNVLNVAGITGTSAVTLASGSGTDTIVVGNAGGTVTISNFESGTGGDVIALDISAIGAVVEGDGADAVVGDAVLLLEATAADTVAAAENIIVLSGTNYATAALAEAAIEDGGTYELTLAGANTAADNLIVVWSDGSNTYIGSYEITSAATNPLTGDLTTLAELTGVVGSTAATLVSANFDFI
jgi:hypothetical protein